MSDKKLQPTVHNWAMVIDKLNEFASGNSIEEIETNIDAMFKATLHSVDKAETCEVDLQTLYMFNKDLIKVFKTLYDILPQAIVETN